MQYGIIIGLCAGLASAVLFYSAARGSPLIGTLLVLLTPLPSMLAGLGWGWLPAALGAFAGSLLMAFIANLPFAVGYFLALGAPVAMAAYLAYLSRPNPNDAAQREWYPAGRLVAALSLYGGALPVLMLPLIGGTYEILRAPMGEFLRRLSARATPDLGIPQLTDVQVEALAELFVYILPGAVAAYWLGIFALNLYLAGRVARASGRLGRDWPDLASLAYPLGFQLLLAAALVATFAPGVLGVAGVGLSGALLLAYFFAGLALMHYIARARAPWILWLVYAGVLFIEPYTAIVLMIAGLLEPAFKFRQRFGQQPPST
ncbi:MAG TPA: DUF2232 domain-containing protein [Hyphomicrobiaceae bacterium]|jgi:hypothetical protein|nr:DUF2232 domain-containing protein [Hyphomicrobiaceae bacterium]